MPERLNHISKLAIEKHARFIYTSSPTKRDGPLHRKFPLPTHRLRTVTLDSDYTEALSRVSQLRRAKRDALHYALSDLCVTHKDFVGVNYYGVFIFIWRRRQTTTIFIYFALRNVFVEWIRARVKLKGKQAWSHGIH